MRNQQPANPAASAPFVGYPSIIQGKLYADHVVISGAVAGCP
jgi:hypothetical protein